MLAMAVGQTAMPSTILLGRGLSALFSVAGVPVLFLIGRRVSGSPVVGLLAALSLAISTNSISNSQVISPNAFLVFFVLLTVWAAVHILQEDKLWPYLVAGVASGLTMSTKYNGVLILLVPVVAHFMRTGGAGFKDRRLYGPAALVPLAFLLTTPYALLDYPHFISAALGQAAHYATGHPGMEGDTVNWYVAYLWTGEGPLVVLAVLEIGYGLVRRSKPSLVLATFPVVYFIFIGSFAVRNDRTILPLVPLLFVLGWMCVIRGFGWLRTRRMHARRARGDRRAGGGGAAGTARSDDRRPRDRPDHAGQPRNGPGLDRAQYSPRRIHRLRGRFALYRSAALHPVSGRRAD